MVHWSTYEKIYGYIERNKSRFIDEHPGEFVLIRYVRGDIRESFHTLRPKRTEGDFVIQKIHTSEDSREGARQSGDIVRNL